MAVLLARVTSQQQVLPVIACAGWIGSTRALASDKTGKAMQLTNRGEAKMPLAKKTKP